MPRPAQVLPVLRSQPPEVDPSGSREPLTLASIHQVQDLRDRPPTQGGLWMEAALSASSGRMAALHTLWMGLVLLGVLQTRAEVQVSVQPNFQQDKFLGRWFTAGLASDASWFQEKKAALPMCTSVVAPTPDGGLNLTVTFLRKDQCETRTLLLRPAGPPGHYSYTSQHWGSVNDVRVAETDYGEYALLRTAGTKGPGQDFHVATLYSRTQTPRAEVKEKFTAFAKAQGFTEDAIVFLPQTDKCVEGHQ